MTDIIELFSGIGIMIDDAFENDDSEDLILKIFDIFQRKQLPTLRYGFLPSNHVQHFHSCSFILLDWELVEVDESETLDGVTVGETLKAQKRNEVLEFISNLRKVTFAPIFIFSNQDTDSIKTELIDKGFYNDKSSNNNIFVCNKSDLIDESSGTNNDDLFFRKIEDWLKTTPSIYVLKEWENSLRKAKRDLFWDFYEIHPEWCSVLKKSFLEDGAYPDYELGSFLYKNLAARSSSIKFDTNIVNGEKIEIGESDMRKVLEGERFLKNDKLPPIPLTGDIYKTSENNYSINIRPECDIARKENPHLYLIKGTAVDESKIKDGTVKFQNGAFIEKINCTYVPCIDNGRIIEFKFDKLQIIKWNEVKKTRIGRLLPPYITRVQQLYSFYIQRQGLPGLPNEIIESTAKSV